MNAPSPRIQALLGLIAFTFIMALECYVRVFHPEKLSSGFYLQKWSSDEMMQTLPIQQLHDAPLANLFYLHIQPPLLDIIRSLFAALSPYDKGIELLHFVDGAMYGFMAVLYAVLAILIFTWVHRATASRTVALAAYAFWLFYPGALALATLLDSTFLSATLTTWLLYELWNFSQAQGSETRTSLAATLLFLTRTVFQWPFLCVLLAALLISGASRKSILATALPVATIMALLLFKQCMLFSTFSTTSFGGEHKLGVIQYIPTPADIETYTDSTYTYPEAALPYMAKYNTKDQIATNRLDEKIAAARMQCCLGESLHGLAQSIQLNATQMLLPVTHNTSFGIISDVFWLTAFNAIFIGPFFAAIALGAVLWLARSRRLQNLAPAIVASFVLCVLLLANRYGWTESERLKFLLEPACYVFVFAQLRSVWK